MKMFFQGESISCTHIADAVLYIYRWPWIDLEETRMDSNYLEEEGNNDN